MADERKTAMRKAVTGNPGRTGKFRPGAFTREMLLRDLEKASASQPKEPCVREQEALPARAALGVEGPQPDQGSAPTENVGRARDEEPS